MRRHLLDLSVLLAIATVACGYFALAQPGDRNIAVHVYVLVVGGLAMLGIVSTFGDTLPRRRRSTFDQALAEASRGDSTPAQVARVEREVTLGVSNAYDLHRLLLPHLREIAQCRLERSGRSPGPDTLGRWWELLRPDREPPEDRFQTGIKLDELRDCLDDLEKIA